jgi:hypothetical protein
VKLSNDVSLGAMSRKSVWFFSTGFWQDLYGSQKNTFRADTFLAASAADLSAKSRPAMKLQKVKSNVMTTFPPGRPMTVFVSTHDKTPFSSLKAVKSSYDRPIFAAFGTYSPRFFLRCLNLTTRGRSSGEIDR